MGVSVLSSPAAATSAPAFDPIAPLGGLLVELADVIAGLRRQAYVACPAPGVSGSIGEHVRHILDHIAALVLADPRAPLSYDHRERGTPVETDPGMALSEIQRLSAMVRRWSALPLDQPVMVISRVSTAGETLASRSTRARELAFVLSHTVHHQAMIALLLHRMGTPTGDRFGVAPSTPSLARAR